MNDITTKLFNIIASDKLSIDERYKKVNALIDISKQLEAKGFTDLTIQKDARGPIKRLLKACSEEHQVTAVAALIKANRTGGEVALLNLLIDEKFEYEKHERDQPNAFMIACLTMNLPALKLLLLRGADYTCNFIYSNCIYSAETLDFFEWIEEHHPDGPMYHLLMAKKYIDTAIQTLAAEPPIDVLKASHEFITALKHDKVFVIDYLSVLCEHCMRYQEMDHRFIKLFIKLSVNIFKCEINPDLKAYAHLQNNVIPQLFAYEAEPAEHSLFEDDEAKRNFIKEYIDGAQFESTLKAMSGNNSIIMSNGDKTDEEDMGPSCNKQPTDKIGVNNHSVATLITARKDSPLSSNSSSETLTENFENKEKHETIATVEQNNQGSVKIAKAI